MLHRVCVLSAALYLTAIPFSAAHYGGHLMDNGYYNGNYTCEFGGNCTIAQNDINYHRRREHGNFYRGNGHMMGNPNSMGYDNRDNRANPGNPGNRRQDNFFASDQKPNIVSVKEALSAKDDTAVVLKGSIIERLDDDDFMFQDASGKVRIEIEKEILFNMSDANISPADELIIEGKLDKEILGKSKIEVYNLYIVNRGKM